MSATIISGKELSRTIRTQIKTEAEEFYSKTGRRVGLAAVKVGDDPASAIYVRNKIKACADCGIRSFEYFLPKETTREELLSLIDTLNADKNIDGILVQLPLPSQLDEREIIAALKVEKDVDGFSVMNAGKLSTGERALAPCTAVGIIELIKSTGETIAGKNAVVLGRSNIVGKPAAQLLLAENATVTVCHSKTQNLKAHTLGADILVAAVGKRNAVTADMVKKGAIVIDVGINRGDDGVKGDVDFDSVSEVAGYITPVPGGVGPMTITMLLKNTLTAAKANG